MTVQDFFTCTQGSRQLCFSEQEKPLCGRDFWRKYRQTETWNAEIDHVRLVSRRAEVDGLWFDGVICIITLK